MIIIDKTTYPYPVAETTQEFKIHIIFNPKAPLAEVGIAAQEIIEIADILQGKHGIFGTQADLLIGQFKVFSPGLPIDTKQGIKHLVTLDILIHDFIRVIRVVIRVIRQSTPGRVR